eukprot:7383030-Prymnesium_polylepis.1
MSGMKKLIVETRDLRAAAQGGVARPFEELEAEVALEVKQFRSERVPRAVAAKPWYGCEECNRVFDTPVGLRNHA